MDFQHFVLQLQPLNMFWDEIQDINQIGIQIYFTYLEEL